MSEPITSRILRLGGVPCRPLNDGEWKRLKHQGEFEHILEALAVLRGHKSLGYGESRLDIRSGDQPRFHLAMAYSDIHRKSIRLLNEVFGATPKNDTNNLIETFSDLAVYAVMGIQIATRLEEKKVERTDHGNDERSGTRAAFGIPTESTPGSGDDARPGAGSERTGAGDHTGVGSLEAFADRCDGHPRNGDIERAVRSTHQQRGDQRDPTL